MATTHFTFASTPRILYVEASGATACLCSKGLQAQRLSRSQHTLSTNTARFRNRVQVFSVDGRYLFHCPASKARELCHAGAACLNDCDKQEQRHWRMTLLRSPFENPASPTSITLFSYRQKYTQREHLLEQYYLVQFRRIYKGDRWAFCLSVTDNLTKPVSQYSSA